MTGALYIVPTPIGNLEDITMRALRVLKEVDWIAAEDTRRTQQLLNHYGIKTTLTSYHEFNERLKALTLVERVKNGASIALVSDAGTPAISDPGFRLVVAAIDAGIPVVALPGPSALVTALCASGLPTDRFYFEGFLPAKKAERTARLQALRAIEETLIFYEAPHRLRESLAAMTEILGDRRVAVAREVSKIHEEFLRGTLSEISRQLAGREVKGEVTVVVHGSSGETAISEERLKSEIRSLTDERLGVKEIAALLGERYGLSKREVYRLALESKRQKAAK
jgi:16S rRNA (cytidine1402-2'-O)-methyltransferase